MINAIAIFFLCLDLTKGHLVNQQTVPLRPQSTQQFQHSAVLDPNQHVILYWDFDGDYITFEVHALTRGWVGIGISPSGSMVDADIHVGWVKDSATITDRHGISGSNAFPPLDVKQNLELLDGKESDGWTVIKFKRELAACEDMYDKEITGDTLRVIYAFGSTDPKGSDITDADYHGATNRGTKSLILLDFTGSMEKNTGNETHMSFDLLNNNFTIPPDNTYYNCRLLKLPDFGSKQHLLKVEPVIQPGNEALVHHIVLYQCAADVKDQELVNTDLHCYLPNMPPDFVNCNTVIHAWAVGATTYYYPPHAGLPLGVAGTPKYVVMETHYDNPDLLSGVVDSSGFRMTYTPDLRKYDAGVLTTGYRVNPFEHLIPPNIETFLSSADCNDQCLAQGLEQGNVTSINVFSVNLHSHLLGTGLVVKHVRNNTELPPLSRDDSYDFNFQENRRLREERVIQKGDALRIVCTYNTKHRTNVSVGGLKTTDEMCQAYLHYWPKIPLKRCLSTPHRPTLMKFFGIESVQSQLTEEGLASTFSSETIFMRTSCTISVDEE